MSNNHTPESLHALILTIIEQIAVERKKTTKHVEEYLFERENTKMVRRFWEILEDAIPGNEYIYLGKSVKTNLYEVRKHLPFAINL